ncbi:hypothetical protein B0A48_05288 [Cryoendolithus antarcticus]|uniref:MYND-type domain-containing protein n=1 Tax=Cryoendolithus antarcticus TaxID=1507870 RepID=A0A1V8TI19_9PEZI|nr:hypothetical protein B0A48_05288 [Cryoendolithus antarcticus]
MASWSSMSAASCAVCDKDAKYRCVKCTEGLGSHGQVDISHYCGKDCQTTHWAAHKGECKVKNARKQLYRAGYVLRQCFRLHSDLLQIDMQTLSDKPEDNLQWGCDLSIPVVMHGLVKAALKGATTGCSEVRVQLEGLPTFGLMSFTEAKHNLFSNTGLVYRVRLPDSSSYVLDLGDAGNTREYAIMPWTEFMDKHVVSIIDSNQLGNCRRGFGNMVRREIENVATGGDVGLKEKIILLIDRHRAQIIAAFEAAIKEIHGMDTLGQILAASSEEYSVMQATFVDHFETTLTGLKERANEEGQFDLHIAAMRAAFS